jgi:2'-5' RNA ligase
MAFAISIRSENEDASPLRQLWKRVEILENAPSMASLNHPPHITLAIYDDIDPEQLRSAAEQVFHDQGPIKLVFSRARYFDNTPLVLWADPSPLSELKRLHDIIHRLIPQSLCRTHYRPGIWTPHCTVGSNVRGDRRNEALAICDEPMKPIKATFGVGDIVSFLPVHVIDQWPLSSKG